MDKRFRFTNERIRALPANDLDSRSTDLEVSDTEVVGLKCLVGKTGGRRLLLRYVISGKKRCLAIGRWPDIDVATARKIARKHKAKIAEGIDPKAEKLAAIEAELRQPEISSFFWSTYLPLIKKRKRTWENDVQRFRDYCEPAIGHLKYPELTARHVQQLQLALISPTKDRQAYANSTANRALAILKTMGKHALNLGVVEVNEAAKISLLPENGARTRFLEIFEIKALIREARKLDQKPISGLICILVLTGARFSEIAQSRHENLDHERKTLFVPRTKNGRSRVFYLSDLAMEIINEIPRKPGNPYIFTGRREGQHIKDCRVTYRACLRRAGITDADDICFHTLRHSTASAMVSAGFSLNDVKEQLQHRSYASSQIYAKTASSTLIKNNDQLAQLFGS